MNKDTNKKGIFIVIEGLDGSGKTTQAKLLVRKLCKSYSAVFTAEPSHGKIGKFIRNRILYGETRPPVSVEALLFAADRIDHINSEVQPALDEENCCFRPLCLFFLAYQGSSGLSLGWIETINQLALKPDLALLIDVAPEVVLERLKRKKSVMENLETQRKVRDIYYKFVEKGELLRIDGDKPKNEVSKEVLLAVRALLKARG